MKKEFHLHCVLCWAVLSWGAAQTAANRLRKKAIRRIHRSMKSILMYEIEKLRCRCPRTNKSTYNILKIVKSITIFPFPTEMY